MRPHTAAAIYASMVAGAFALVAAIEALDRRQHGYRLSDSFLVEAGATVAFYFILVFVLVAKFPARPIRLLTFVANTFRLSSLRTPSQRLAFIVLCVGALVLAITSIAYFVNGHDDLLGYWFGGRRLAPSDYRPWLWLGLLASSAGLLGSFLYGATVRPLVRWVRGERPPPGDA